MNRTRSTWLIPSPYSLQEARELIMTCKNQYSPKIILHKNSLIYWVINLQYYWYLIIYSKSEMWNYTQIHKIIFVLFYFVGENNSLNKIERILSLAVGTKEVILSTHASCWSVDKPLQVSGFKTRISLGSAQNLKPFHQELKRVSNSTSSYMFSCKNLEFRTSFLCIELNICSVRDTSAYGTEFGLKLGANSGVIYKYLYKSLNALMNTSVKMVRALWRIQNSIKWVGF